MDGVGIGLKSTQLLNRSMIEYLTKILDQNKLYENAHSLQPLTEVWTSRFWTWLSNLSMTAETFWRSMEFRALSRALVTWPMFLVT